MTLSLESLSFVRRGATVLSGVTITIPDRALTCLIGPNGAGKTTLLHILCGELRATSGKFLVNNTDSSSLSQREIARQISIIPQNVPPPPYLTVSELAELGRVQCRGALWRRLSPQDHAIVEACLTRCQMDALSGRRVEELSGGEQKRAWLAFGLAQEKRFLLLDETLDGLDFIAKRSFFKLLKSIVSEDSNKGILLTTHDLDLVAEFGDWVIMLSGGRVSYTGGPEVDLQHLLSSIG